MKAVAEMAQKIMDDMTPAINNAVDRANEIGRASMRRDILAILERHGVSADVIEEVRKVE